MFRSLTIKLSLAFLLISIIGAVLSALIARQTTLTEFDRLVLERTRSTFITTVSEYYQENGSWDGIEAHLQNLEMVREPRRDSNIFNDPFAMRPDGDFNQPSPGDSNSNKTPRPLLFALVDTNGIVLNSSTPYSTGEQIDATTLAEGVPVELEGRVIGTVLTSDYLPKLDPRDERYLERTNISSFYAAVIAAVIALLVGIILARTMTKPLRTLTNAISAVARGELKQQVSINSRDELGELATAFNSMSADLAHANQLRRQMTADIAHDLRSPLTVISGYVESMRDGVLEPDMERLDIINDEVNHLQRLVDDLRTLSLADANELTLNRQSFVTKEFIERLALTYQHQAQKQQIAIHTYFDASLPDLYIDSERVMQVLGNLLDNSLRHTPEGGCISISVRQHLPGNSILITIEDNGEGIPADALPNIFERFYRADPSRHRREGETGLGLAIARSIVEAHQGKISVESSLSEGTKFTIELPLQV